MVTGSRIVTLRKAAIRMFGKADSNSPILMMTSSTHLPTKPAVAPSVTPIVTLITITTMATKTAVLAPLRIRLVKSRPSTSVPIQWSRLGASAIRLKSFRR